MTCNCGYCNYLRAVDRGDPNPGVKYRPDPKQYRAVADAREHAEQGSYGWREHRQGTKAGQVISAVIIAAGALALAIWVAR